MGIRFYNPLELTCCLFFAYCHEFINSMVPYTWTELQKSTVWLINYWKELREFVLFIKLFVITKMNILKNLLRGIESDLAYTKASGVASQYILWSRSLWHPVRSSMRKNKRHFSLVILKLMSAFSTVQLDLAKNHIN